VQRIKRGGEVFVPDDDTVLEPGDIVAVVGLQSVHKLAQDKLGPEVVDYDVLDRSVESRAVIVANKKVEGRTLSEMNFAKDYRCWLTRLTRSGVPISRRPDLKLRIGDILVFTGARSQIEKLAERLGHLERRLDETDLVTFAFGISLGILFGIPSFKLGTTPVGLGTAGGVLLSGLILGLLHSSRPTFGRLPSPARYILMELGLLLFMAHIAVSAGGTIVDAFKDVGPTLALCGVAVTVVPVIACFLVGRFVLRMNAALLLGAVTGSMTSTAALQQVSAQANSTLPTLGYVGTYAFANVLLAVAGGLIMRI
jgi:putative transport protein